MLLEIKDTKRRPMTGALQVGSDIGAERQVQDRPQKERDQVKNDDGVGE